MKTDSGNHTHSAKTPEQAQHYRAVATGVGQTLRGSEMTGARRAQRVADCMPADQRAALVPNSGYPAPRDPAMYGKGY